jgi:hypothetical protein
VWCLGYFRVLFPVHDHSLAVLLVQLGPAVVEKSKKAARHLIRVIRRRL